METITQNDRDELGRLIACIPTAEHWLRLPEWLREDWRQRADVIIAAGWAPVGRRSAGAAA